MGAEPARQFGSIREVSDPDLAPPDHDGPSPLDALRDELMAPVDADEVTLAVPGRSGWAVRYSTALTYDQLVAWRKRATDRNEVNEVRLAALILAGQSRALIRNGEDLVEDGTPVTLRSRTLLEMYDVDRVAEVVVKFYGNDFDVAAAGNRVLREAGFGSEAPAVDEEDAEGPTQP